MTQNQKDAVRSAIDNMKESKEELRQIKDGIISCLVKLSEVERELCEFKMFEDARSTHELMQSLSVSVDMIEEHLGYEQK